MCRGARHRIATFVEQAGVGYQRGPGRLIDALARILQSSDDELRANAVSAWGAWEDWHISIGTGGYKPNPRWQEPSFAVPFATLVSHFWSNHAFLTPPIVERMDLIGHIPGHLIHGRLDVSGPVVTAWKVHRLWPASTLTIVEAEGHGGELMVSELTDATTALADHLAAG